MLLMSSLGPFGSFVVLMVPGIAYAAQKAWNISENRGAKKENRVPNLLPIAMPLVLLLNKILA